MDKYLFFRYALVLWIVLTAHLRELGVIVTFFDLKVVEFTQWDLLPIDGRPARLLQTYLT